MSCLKLFDRNYLDTATKTVSSADADYPVSNLYNIYRRSRAWRSKGFFEITALNNSLVFREAVGVDLTATIAVGTYATPSLLAAALKTALEAAGVATYTPSFSTTTGKWTILSDLGGGATVFQPRFATSTAIAAVLGFDATNLTGAATYTGDVVAIHTSEWLLWDFGIATNPTDFALVLGRNEYLNISPSATVVLEGNHTNNFTTPAYSASLELTDYAIFQTSEDGLHTEPLRYWRLRVVDPANPDLYVQANLVFLGDAYSPTEGCPQFPLNYASIDRSSVVFAESGQTYADIRPVSESFQLDIQFLVKAEVERLQSIFEEFGLGIPLFISVDSEEAFSTDKTVWLKWCRFEQPPQYALTSPNRFACRMALREEL